MKNFFLVICFLVIFPCSGQDNFVEGFVITSDGQRKEGLINDQLWSDSPKSIEFKDGSGVKTTFTPPDLLEFGIGAKTYYKSFAVKYDSSANLKELSRQFQPELKYSHLFLRVILDSKTSLLEYEESRVSHYFILKGDQIEELINHFFYVNVEGTEMKRLNPTYVEQLRKLMSNCSDVKIENNLPYTEKSLTKLFTDYNTCTHDQQSTLFVKEKPILKAGLVGQVAFDKLRKNFDEGGVGFGGGLFFNVMFPNNLYKLSLYNEITYRKFGNQFTRKSGGSFTPTFTEEFKINSIKITSLIRNRVGEANTFINAGVTFNFGLSDEFIHEEGTFSWTATKAKSNAGLVIGFGTKVGEFTILECRYERGGGVNFNDTIYLTSSSGYSTIAFVIAVEL